MQNDFEANNLKNAKELLSKDLKIAQNAHEIYKERQKILENKTTIWSKIKSFFGL
ncbi:hypothetical protein MNB_SV-5-1540 [hydrothermal vent metagenome]|uniref:Uncharacterized protein n=1 Tax=hydrothermal vent metagenome TaxID=652676 RepID=A0A1W1EES3_9ZZZZ